MNETRMYYVWDPAIEGFEDAQAYEAPTPMLAAELYAEDNYDGWSSVVLIVTDSSGEEFTVDVGVDMVPMFSGRKL